MTENINQTLIENNAHIPISEIKQDLIDTQREIDDYTDEKNILMRDPQANKVRIYMLEGKISQRENFIKKLQIILDNRLK